MNEELYTQLVQRCPVQFDQSELDKLIEDVTYNIYVRKHFNSFKEVLTGIKDYEAQGYSLIPEQSRNAPNGGLYTLCFEMTEAEKEDSKKAAIEMLTEDYQQQIEMEQGLFVQTAYKELEALAEEQRKAEELKARIKKNTSLLKLLN
ncbi:hypothetical protein [Vibrio diazotrophicus]|uniref:hypothetical protein n=1 Tax=Vibrio diazotrophicus TaxID=685 RepID=UPI000C9E2627|nr:hypothetical protein [Vibrio diazotrophicus]PNH81350.1 hypothetical protein C1N27_07340 [Vibrio diazotrophicus]